MTIAVAVATTSKAGRAPAENEDAVAAAVRPAGPDRPAPTHRVVVADGASESYLARLWARHLVQVVAHGPEDPVEGIAQARAGWPEISETHRQDRAASGRPLEWFEDAALARGAASTLLAVDVTPDGATAWAIGDTCAFHLRGTHLVTSFPLHHSTQLGSSPPLVGSAVTGTAGPSRPLDQVRLDLLPGDRIILATDALAAWALTSVEGSAEPWSTLWAISGDQELGLWAGRERGEGRLKNDDTTIVRLARAEPHG